VPLSRLDVGFLCNADIAEHRSPTPLTAVRGPALTCRLPLAQGGYLGHTGPQAPDFGYCVYSWGVAEVAGTTESDPPRACDGV
jgi:hypothetical protein